MRIVFTNDPAHLIWGLMLMMIGFAALELSAIDHYSWVFSLVTIPMGASFFFTIKNRMEKKLA